MAWLTAALDRLSRRPVIGYSDTGTPSAEPTALAAIALCAHGRPDAAAPAASFLLDLQSSNGSVGIRAGEPTPEWPTSLAVMAWRCLPAQDRFEQPIARAVSRLLDTSGLPLPRTPDMGHNSRLVGWSWAAATHSWLEPTAFAVIALRMAGQREHPRVREGTDLLIDRQLAGGGCNYGNTVVFGQPLRPHAQPTGIALVALAGEGDPDGRVAGSAAWLEKSLGLGATALSLGWALLGLRAHGRTAHNAGEWLAAAAAHVDRQDRSAHKLAVLALAAKGWPA